jgi:hypothetical protein
MNSNRSASFALVEAKSLHPRVPHVLGLPAELSLEGQRRALPRPDVVVIESESEGNVFLYRLTRSGEPCGDTWHQSIEDAQHQAAYEYGELLSEWRTVPQEVVNIQQYAISVAQNRKAHDK